MNRLEAQADSRREQTVCAYRLFKKALRDGILKRQPCEICGAPNSDGHHEDYAKPLEVQWLCEKHHYASHAELRKKQRAARPLRQLALPLKMPPPPVKPYRPPVLPLKMPVYKPQELRPVQEFCADGTLWCTAKTAERMCKTGALPAVKNGQGQWCTTLVGIRSYFWHHGNEAFKKMHY